jgi:RNA polymerase subunit RPABC4/transcription elongation factor Spt4
MKKKECPSCAMEIDNSENVCPICGYEFPEGANPWYVAIAVILVLIFLLFMIL